MPDTVTPHPRRTGLRRALATAAKLGLAVSLWWMGVDAAHARTPAVPPATTALAGEVVIDAAALYRQHCATCHGAQRTGGMGPALLPESLERLKPADALATIARGRDATQMPGFGGVLTEMEVAALAAYVRTPVQPTPRWGDADIRASRVATPLPPDEPVRPAWRADPMNLFVVVEGGDHHVSLLDGDRFEVIHRFASRYALHGGPKFTPDGRHVFFGSRDGWITKYDLWRLKVVAEVRAGLNMRNIAVSADGRWVAAANYLPHSVVLFDSDLKLVQTLPATNARGSESSRVSAVYDAAPRQSFVVALKDTAELWELPYGPASALARGRPSTAQRTLLDGPLDDFFFDPPYRHVLGATRPASGARADAVSAQVIDLNARRKVADLAIAGMPHLGSGIAFSWQGRTVLASPNLKGGGIDVIDLANWQPVATIPTPGPGFFLRGHEASPYVWADSMMGPKSKDTLTVIDKATLKPVASVKEPGKTLAHIEFTRDGRYALASVWEMDGALVVYDAKTLQEVKRLPMRKPVGKYNVWNKITRSEGTSH